MIAENAVNNNSVVAKLNYKGASILFTGDIEEVAENRLAETYGDALDCDILKVRTPWLGHFDKRKFCRGCDAKCQPDWSWRK